MPVIHIIRVLDFMNFFSFLFGLFVFFFWLRWPTVKKREGFSDYVCICLNYGNFPKK